MYISACTYMYREKFFSLFLKCIMWRAFINDENKQFFSISSVTGLENFVSTFLFSLTYFYQ